MKFIRRVKKLEAAASKGTGAWGLVWDGNYQKLTPEEAQLGGGLAIDLEVRVMLGVVQITGRERRSEIDGDYGLVRDPEGETIGRVTAIGDELVTIEYLAGYDSKNLPLRGMRRGHRERAETTAG